MSSRRRSGFSETLSRFVTKDGEHRFLSPLGINKGIKSLDYWTRHNPLLMAEEVFFESRNAVFGKLDFISSCIGYSLGLGNTWRFPTSCLRGGGGSFLLAYLILTVFIGLPLLILELCLSQFTGKGVAECWYFAPGFRGIGYSMVLTNLSCTICYTVMLGWVLFYIISSMQFVIPFLSCHNQWNDFNCVSSGLRTGNASNKESSSEQFWLRFVITRISYDNKLINHIGNGLSSLIWYSSSCMVIAWTISAVTSTKGVKIVERWNLVVTTFPYLVMFCLILLSVQLPGSLNGLYIFIIPQMKYFFNLKTWIRAAEQIFFSFGVGLGGMLTMGSRNKFNRNIKHYLYFIYFFNIGTAILSGITMFLIVGFMMQKYLLSLEQLTEMAGNGLFFIVYPECFGSFTVPQIVSCAFYIMIFIHGIDSMFIIIETVITGFANVFPAIEETKYHRICFGLLLHLLCAIYSLIFVTKNGYEWFKLFENYTLSLSLPATAFFESFAIVYIYKYKNFSRDYYMMIGEKPSWIWNVLIYITPLVLLTLICITILTYERTSLGYGFHLYILPKWADIVGLVILSNILVPIPIYFLFRMHRKIKQKQISIKEALKHSISPNLKWGPMKKRYWLLDPYYKNRLTELKEECENYQNETGVFKTNIVIPNWFHKTSFNEDDIDESIKSQVENVMKSTEKNILDISVDFTETKSVSIKNI